MIANGASPSPIKNDKLSIPVPLERKTVFLLRHRLRHTPQAFNSVQGGYG
jgi:hypothetical protein